MVFFLPNGNHVGSNIQTCTLTSDSRHEVYERYTYSIRQISPSSQQIYFEAIENITIGNFKFFMKICHKKSLPFVIYTKD